MTEALTKKATHILDQAMSKDSLREFDIAYKLYCDGIEYFETAINYETNPKIKTQMMETMREYQLRQNYLNKCLNEDDDMDWDDIVAITDFQSGMLVKMSSLSISVMENIDDDDYCEEEQDDQDDDEQEEEDVVTKEEVDDDSNESKEIVSSVILPQDEIQDARDEIENKTENEIDIDIEHESKTENDNKNDNEHLVAPNECKCFGFW